MSLRSKLIIAGILTAFAFPAGADTGLYGFNLENPYTYEEDILSIEVPPRHIVNYREKMRDNLISLSRYAKNKNKNFQIIVHGGQELLSKSLWEQHLEGYNDAREKDTNADDPSFLTKLKQPSSAIDETSGYRDLAYTQNIDAIVLNNRFCRPQEISPIIRNENIKLISIDHCPNGKAFDKAVEDAVATGSLTYPFINKDEAFKHIVGQPVINENAKNIYNVRDAQNVSFLLNDSEYENKENFIDDIRRSNYDIVVINPLFHNREILTAEDIDRMKFKKNGTRRQIIALFNVSEIRNNPYLRKLGWKVGNPSWLKRISFVSNDSIITEYWNDAWKKIMGRNFEKIINSGYDGAFLTGIENHRYFEKQTPLE